MSDKPGSTGPKAIENKNGENTANTTGEEKASDLGKNPENYRHFGKTPLSHIARETPGGEVHTNLTIPEDPSRIDPDTHEVRFDKVPTIIEARPARKRGWFTALVASGAVLLGGAGTAGAMKVFGGDEAQPKTPATAPPIPGQTTKPETSPSNGPEATPSKTPTDIESSLNNGAAEKEKAITERRAIFTNQAIRGEMFTPFLVSEKTFDAFKAKAKDAGLPSEQKDRPGIDVVPLKMMTAETLEASKKTLDKAFEDGTVQNALDEINRAHGTKFTIDDLTISKSEIPTGSDKAETKAFLSKVALIPDLTTAVALTIGKQTPSDPQAGKEFLNAAFVTEEYGSYDWFANVMARSADKEAGYKTYVPAKVSNPNSSLLVSNVDGRGTPEEKPGMVIDGEGGGKNVEELRIPVFGVYSEVEKTTLSENGVNTNRTVESTFRLMTTVPAAGKTDTSYVLLVRESPVNLQ